MPARANPPKPPRSRPFPADEPSLNHLVEGVRRGKTTHATAKPKPKPPAHHKSKQGVTRQDTPPYHYGPADRFPHLGRPVAFRVTAILSSGRRAPLEMVERVTWEDANAITTGQLSLRELATDADSPERRLDQGDRIVLEASVGGAPFQEVWTMRCYKPEAQSSSLQRTFNLANDLELLRQSEDNFYYRKTGPDMVTVASKTKPQGWTGPEVIRDVCQRYQVPLGQLYASKKPIGKLLIRRGSPLEVIRNVLVREHRRNNLRLVLRFDNGRLSVTTLKRSPHLLALGPTLIEASFQSEMPEQFGTAITMHGLQEFAAGQDVEGRPKSKRQKMHVDLESTASRRQFGYVHRIVFSPDARTDADLRQEGLLYLAAIASPRRTVMLSHDGMPWLRRGDAIQLALGDEGLRRQVVWVNSVSHIATPQSYRMDVQVIFDDPYRDKAKETLLFRLKQTHDEAVGNRARTNPLWYLPKNLKADAAINAAQPFTPTDPNQIGGDPSLPPGSDGSGGPF
jgi:hypothetical protein